MDNQNPVQPPLVNPIPSIGTPSVVELVPPQIDQPQAPPSGKFSLSPKIILIILAFLIVAVIGSGIYLSAGTQPKPTPKLTPMPTTISKPTPTPDPTASWKTYTNNDYSIKYPSSLSVSERLEKTLPGSSTATFKNDAILQNAFITIDAWTNNQNKALQIFVTDYSNGLYTKENTMTFQVNNTDGLGYINGGNKVIFISNKDKIYIFGLQNAYDVNTNNVINKTSEDTFNKMLSTFKFTDNVPTPTCRPRPACLDVTPRCLIPETSDMCPPRNSTESGLTK